MLKVIKITTLEELPCGSLFFFGTTLGFKSEYSTDRGAIEAYIIGSGEMFWGGTTTAEEQGALRVIQVSLELDKETYESQTN